MTAPTRLSRFWPVPVASLHLLLHLGALATGSGLHLRGLAAAPADVPEEAQVGPARHHDRHHDDNGGAEGGGDGVPQDGRESPQTDSR